MAHFEQAMFCANLRGAFPDFFDGKKVLEVGSRDFNGSPRVLFQNCDYIGLDAVAGKCVDVVTVCHEYDRPDESFDTVISTSTLEYDIFYSRTLRKMTALLKKGGLMVLVCASLRRDEDISSRKMEADYFKDAPLPGWPEYYRPLTEVDVRNALDLEAVFEHFFFLKSEHPSFLFFVGIKRGGQEHKSLSMVLKRVKEYVFFDEEFYLEKYPDVMGAVKMGFLSTGKQHFQQHGLAESREFRTVRIPTVYGVMHVAQMNHWRQVLEDQFSKIERSGLLSRTKKIFIGVVGRQGEIDIPSTFRDKVEVFFRSDCLEFYEFPTIAKVQTLASTEDCFVWYIHTKGVTTQTKDKENWRQFMEYFILDHWRFCCDSLVGNDVSGVMWHECHDGGRFFAGNFWWASSRHIRKLPLVQSLDWHSRNLAERWITSVPPQRVGVADLYCNFEHGGILAHGLGCRNGSLIIPDEYASFPLAQAESYRRSHFDEDFYLLVHPDIHRVVKTGEFRTGYDHYIMWGRKERREARFRVQKKLETILLTACFRPFTGMPDVVVTDESIRAIQYLYSLIYWSSLPEVGSIIFCESSGMEFDFSKIAAFVAARGKKLEILRVDGSGWNAQLGKGHAEAKIFDHVGQNSKLLRECLSFYKVTGRIGVENFTDISYAQEMDDNVFRYGSDSTKFFKTSVQVFEKYLMGLSDRCDDRRGATIEELVSANLNEFFWVDFFINPIMIGQSGGFGDKYSRAYGMSILELAVSLLPDSIPKDGFQIGSFDEVFYLTRYPEVAKAVGFGEFDSGFVHYFMFGRREGREAKFK